MGRDNGKAVKEGYQNTDFMRTDTSMRDHKRAETTHADFTGQTDLIANIPMYKEGNSNDFVPDGSDTEEQYGLSLEERKRQRREAHNPIPQKKKQVNNSKDSILSNSDCVETSPSLLAKLAMKASQ